MNRSPYFKPALIVIVTIALLILVSTHTNGFNGPWYWKWPWRQLSAWIYPLMLIAAVPFAVAQWLWTRQKRAAAIVLITLGCFTLQLAAISIQPPTGGGRLLEITQHAINMSYWTDAVVIDKQENIPLRDWLLQYPDIVPLLHYHAKYKPPGLMLYFLFWVKLLGRGNASAWAGGTGIAILASLAVPACYRMIRFFTRNDDGAFLGASYLSLCPALILFLPQFDQVYPLIACGIVTFWGVATRDGNWKAAIACGVTLALGLFMSYIFLVLGCAMALYWLFVASWRGIINGIITIATVVLLYGLLWATTGFDPIATFRVISRKQAEDLLILARPFPIHLLHDFLDFALGVGWIGVLIAAMYIVRAGRQIDRFALVAVVQIIVVGLAALLPGEAARLWLLLMPLLMAPIGLELAKWDARSRYVTYACLWLLMVAICRNMTFLYMGPELDGRFSPFSG